MKKALSFFFLLVLLQDFSFGQVSVSGSTGADGAYLTLGAAFANINANSNQTGNTIYIGFPGIPMRALPRLY